MTYNCFNCPYGKESFEKRMMIFKKYGVEPDFNALAREIYCDKVGGQVGWAGSCEDAYMLPLPENDNIKKTNSKLAKRQKKRNGQRKYKKHLKNLTENISGYPQPAMLVEEKWDKELEEYVKLDTPYYKRLYGTKSRRKFYKKRSNKQVRRYKGEVQNGGFYKKIYDYQWDVD